MKKIVSCLLVVVMMCALFTTVVAGAGFVPSVSYKPAPEIVDIVDKDDDALIIVPVGGAEDDTKLPEDIKKDLLEQYENLSDDDTKLSDLVPGLSDEMVIKDLFAVSESDKDSDIFKDGKVDVVLKSNVGKDEKVFAIVYADGAWKKVAAKNNGNGTVTVTMEKSGVVALLTADADVDVPATGDNSNIGLWVTIMVAAAAMIVVLVVARRRTAK